MNDGGWGAAPRSGCRREGARSILAASASWLAQRPLPLRAPTAPAVRWLRTGGCAGGRRDLAGVSGLGCGGGVAASLVALSGLAEGRGDEEGGGEYQWKVKFYLPLRESCGFSPGDGRILPLSYTASTAVAAAERPQTPPSRAAPQLALCCYPHLSVGSLPAPYPAWCLWGGGWLREGLMA